jgi:hypothetical protein
MTSAVFSIDIRQKKLIPLTRHTMAGLKLSEPYDLETWLASASTGLFGRSVIWISRQDRASDDQRSDLIGIDQSGDLLVTELKCGELNESAITQALSYAAEYHNFGASELAKLFSEHSAKTSATGLITRVDSLEDGLRVLSAHVGEDNEVNDAQVVVLVAEEFTAKALAICDYINSSSTDATFSIECWRYTIFSSVPEDHKFLLEQVLPPPSVRQEIEEKREASKSRKYARDPIRVEFMSGLISYFRQTVEIVASRNRGQSYECRIQASVWTGAHHLVFSISGNNPRLILPASIRISRDSLPASIVPEETLDGTQILQFAAIKSAEAIFTNAFGDQLRGVISKCAEQPGHSTA